MIKFTRLDKSDILINPDLIEHIELNSDTVVTLTNGRSFVVKESSDEIQGRVIEFRRKCFQPRLADQPDFNN
ncbi:MAG: flagellar protein FlbD [Acidobacteria bacterium]|nr:MAG: flagellar protein FlbD [Acidobacteriota bacterium]